MGEQTPDSKKLYETLGALRIWAQQHQLSDARERIERMMMRGKTTKTLLTYESPDGPLPEGAEEKIIGSMALQTANALEGCIQIVHRIKQDRSTIRDIETVRQVRLVHDWAEALVEAKKLPLKGKKKGSVTHKIEYLGQRLQQLEFGHPGMTGATTGMGAQYQPSTFAGRTGDALFQKELDLDDEKDRSH